MANEQIENRGSQPNDAANTSAEARQNLLNDVFKENAWQDSSYKVSGDKLSGGDDSHAQSSKKDNQTDTKSVLDNYTSGASKDSQLPGNISKQYERSSRSSAEKNSYSEKADNDSYEKKR